MQVIGIICEYNPFHNGHLYHINKIKQLYKDSIIILVVNGYFMQRGEASILSKQSKTEIALDNNIDLVLELPAIFGTQSADKFAYHSIEILNYFKVDKIIFGSESNNIKILENIADEQLKNNHQDSIKEYLKSGLNYPTALAKTLNIKFNYNNPNDLLAISYIKAIKQINSNIEFECIKRTNDYHDIKSNNAIISASNIRNKIKDNLDISTYLPSSSQNKILTINYKLLFSLFKYKINTCDNLNIYLDVDEGIENKLKKEINNAKNIDDFITHIKSKRYTYNKLKRMLIHILLDFKKNDNLTTIQYIKILGFNHNGQNYLNKIKKNITIPLKPEKESTTYKIEHNAVILYDLITDSQARDFEIKNKPIKK